MHIPLTQRLTQYQDKTSPALVRAHPQTASFDPERRFRSFEFLDIARYACGFKIAQALL
jgi:hypothetical protein